MVHPALVMGEPWEWWDTCYRRFALGPDTGEVVSPRVRDTVSSYVFHEAIHLHWRVEREIRWSTRRYR